MQTPPPEPSSEEIVFSTETPASPPPAKTRKDTGWIYTLLLLLILASGAYLRFRGIAWDEYQYVHPDERFLGFVENDIQPVKSFGEYFDTANSTLNPMNRGHGFFVYGTLPIFLLRYVMEWTDKSGYANFAAMGRPLSGLFDLATILILYLIASKLFNRKVGLLAAAFSAFAVLQIQLSHFFTVDIYANFFIWLALYYAVVIAQLPARPANAENNLLFSILKHPGLLPSLLFGLFAGMALASKVSAYPLVLILPFAAAIYLLRQPQKDRMSHAIELTALMAVGGALCLVAFRVFQPYAFTGPGFFDIKPNPEWIEALKNLQNLLQPSIGYPPAVQWIDRPLWFSGYNLSAWGLGWPLALAAWVGMLWMGWRIFRKRELQPLLVIWAWTTGHFIWQSLAFNPTMRYQLPIYPGMALLGAWALWELYSLFRPSNPEEEKPQSALRFTRPLALALGAIVLLATGIYAYAFSGIYTRQVTRLEASRWMYANIPGAINLHIQTDGATRQQPVPFINGFSLRQGEAYTVPFTAQSSGVLSEVTLGKVMQENALPESTGLLVQLLASPSDTVPLGTSVLVADFVPARNGDNGYTFSLDQPISLIQQQYTLKIELFNGTQGIEICGDLHLLLQTASGQMTQTLAAPANCTVTPENPVLVSFVPDAEGILSSMDATSIVNPQAAPTPVTLTLNIQTTDTQPLASATRTVTPDAPFSIFEPSTEPFTLDTPVTLTAGQTYYLQIATESSGQVRIAGSAIAVESSWDDSLPYRLDGYDPYGGIYTSDLNFEMYWFDDAAKRQRFYDTLDGADVVTISSSRQWGSVGRLGAIYPISSAYYRALIGCPADRSVEWCYNVAEPGMFQGQLGFELIRTFDSNPRVGPIQINDQPSEEAFTVYDHPKVFIFAKTADFDVAKVEAILAPLPLGQPLEAVKNPTGDVQTDTTKSLLLPPDRLSDQQNGGTWYELFNPNGIINTNELVTFLLWYAAITLLGVIMYPIIRLALPGLDDRGYPLARTAGVLVLAYMVWLAGSYEIPVLRVTISMAVMVMALIGLLTAFFTSKALCREIAEKWRYFLTIEGLTLAFFLFLMFIRMANPDLWHPWKGGEKPMDFAYLNAVIRSTTFPPYDPWFSGGYINYYYYGFVIVGVLVKWLGVVPAIAYNLILPTLFSMLAMGVFSIGWNLAKGIMKRKEDEANRAIVVAQGEEGEATDAIPITYASSRKLSQYFPYMIGLAAAIGIVVLGNLGTPKMILRGYERLGADPSVEFDDAFFLTKWGWALKGFSKVMGGESLPYSLGDWYWIPSRAIPAPGEVEPITEFPIFTFLYADLHAHMMSLPITVLALAWVFSVVMARGRWESPFGGAFSFLLAAITIGALRPTNTWDFPTYLALGVIGWGYAAWQGHREEGLWSLVPANVGRLIKIVLGAGVLAFLAVKLYQPFVDWYALGYTEINVWEGTHTPLSAYLTHWGLFLFLIGSWMLWETLDWLAHTPISAVRTLKTWFAVIVVGILGLFGAIAFLMFKYDASISWLVLIMAAWAAILLFRPGMPDMKRWVLFLVGTGLVLTQTVEIVVLFGDIGRMNTVFKFYIQVWILFGVSAAASLAWLIADASGPLRAYLEKLYSPVQRVWQTALTLMVFGAALFPIMASMAKMKDRIAENLPVTLDGQTYMETAHYNFNGIDMPLAEDYRAMQWLGENVQGSPPIVEAQLVEYTWGSRFSINTGLPAVLGWNWHQRQQRTGHDADVWQRANEITNFYETGDAAIAVDFLNHYGVRYIIVGQLERAAYSPEGLAKFDQWNGQYWHEVFRDGQTVIYEVGG